jgi:hypothetical protein
VLFDVFQNLESFSIETHRQPYIDTPKNINTNHNTTKRRQDRQ